MELGDKAHHICHETRDDVADLLYDTFSLGTYKTKLNNFHNDTAERIANFFRKLLRDDSIQCIVRIVESPGGKVQYTTRGRSKGMPVERKRDSEPIPSTEGLAKYFLETQGGLGVALCNDIPELIRLGIWKKTKNDSIGDVKTAMVAPINNYNFNQHGIIKKDGVPEKAMLGMLCIVSGKSPFRAIHSNPLKAFADLIGLTLPSLFHRIPNDSDNQSKGKPHVAFPPTQAGKKK